MMRSIYIWEKPLGPVLGYWSAPPRIFVEEAHILKNASKLAKIPVHIVQVNKFPIMGECLKTAAAHSPNKDDSIFPFLSMRFFQKVELHKSFPRSITPPLKPCQANFATSFCTAAFKSCPVLHFLSIKLSSGPELSEIYEDFEMHCISLLKL